MRIISPTFRGIWRRLKFTIDCWLNPSHLDATFENLFVREEPEKTIDGGDILYKQPAGPMWRPLWDKVLNARLDRDGMGWRNWEAVEIWRDTMQKPRALFTSTLEQECTTGLPGLWWRPLLTAAKIERRWN